jgi:hypothetical protein
MQGFFGECVVLARGEGKGERSKIVGELLLVATGEVHVAVELALVERVRGEVQRALAVDAAEAGLVQHLAVGGHTFGRIHSLGAHMTGLWTGGDAFAGERGHLTVHALEDGRVLDLITQQHDAHVVRGSLHQHHRSGGHQEDQKKKSEKDNRILINHKHTKTKIHTPTPTDTQTNTSTNTHNLILTHRI